MARFLRILQITVMACASSPLLSQPALNPVPVNVIKPNNESDVSNSEFIFDVGYSQQIFKDVNLTDARAATHVFTKRLVKNTGLPISVQTHIYGDIKSVEEAISNTSLDLVILLPEEFIEATQYVAIDPFAVASRDNSVYDIFLLLVHKNRGIHELADLVDRTIDIISGSEGAIPRMWVEVLLDTEHLKSSKFFFARNKQVHKVSQAVLSVFFGQTDACIVAKRAFDTMVELNPQISDSLTVLKSSPQFVNGISCINTAMGVKEHRDVLEQVLLKLHKDTEGKQLLSLFKTQKLVPYKSSYLESTRRLIKEYKAIVHKNGSPD